MSDVLDLFGNPMLDEPPRRGRPQHAVTPETRNRVSMLLALGWSNARIASVLNITLPTLRKHYFFELRQREAARDRMEARRFELAWKAAVAGNVGAMREVGRLLDRNDAMLAEAAFAAPAAKKDTATPSPAAGKKDQQKLQALEAEDLLMKELDAEAEAVSRALN
ncbi:hypothetical protein [Stappia sp. WLB 29]|uniref:hypothetical protein n=1 Tax=Stappia sp. WLB 29 TaxID=2925220 RepID=UPI0020C0BAFD